MNSCRRGTFCVLHAGYCKAEIAIMHTWTEQLACYLQRCGALLAGLHYQFSQASPGVPVQWPLHQPAENFAVQATFLPRLLSWLIFLSQRAAAVVLGSCSSP